MIQPHLPGTATLYDYTPITSPTFDGSSRVESPASGVARFRDVTGGVLSRERIHPGVADPGLLLRLHGGVSASNPNRDRLFGIRSPPDIAARCTGQCSTCVALDMGGMMDVAHLPPVCHRQSRAGPKCWQHATEFALVAGLNPTSHDTS